MNKSMELRICNHDAWLFSAEAYEIYAQCMYQASFEDYTEEMKTLAANPDCIVFACFDGAKAAEPAELAQPTKPLKLTEPTELAQPTKPLKLTEPVETARLAKPVGMIVIEKKSEETAEIVGIATRKELQRRGIGSFMVKAACVHLVIARFVAETDDDAVDFYRKAGFSVHRFVRSFPDGDVVRYRCLVEFFDVVNSNGDPAEIKSLFVKGDLRGAMEYMKSHDEYKDILPAYVDLFEKGEYLHYDVPEALDRVLLAYQEYFRSVFYFRVDPAAAAERLLGQLRTMLNMPDADEDQLTDALTNLCESNGYHALFGDTQGYYGPYIWRETVPTTYHVELPGGTADYTVNLLKGFVFRSWMDYLTFGKHGTGGWASKDGTINCVAQAYDLEGEAFQLHLLKHEAQHVMDMKKYPGITATQLEYRAKLVELHYAADPVALLQRFISEANDERTDDSHGVAAAWVRRGFADSTPDADPDFIRAHALQLLESHNAEMDNMYVSDMGNRSRE